MQVILVLTDIGEDKITYSMFEARGEGESMQDIVSSPSVQIGAVLSAFLKTAETYNVAFAEVVISEEVKSKYPNYDWREKLLKSDSSVIHLDLNKLKPKGNS
jgi:hypothetical protein